MSSAMPPYHYSDLSHDMMIRLLRLLPHEDENAPIQCQLFNFSLQESGQRTHPYDALSYVWGGSEKPQSIFIGERDLLVTVNLHEALSRLRHRFIERIIWVDAVCINQEKEQEKEQQIWLMAKIYGQANRVVVWLGEAADDSDRALEEIRVAGVKKFQNSSSNETIQQAVFALLQRPWFRRIWILQEVAAARHVLIMCGLTEIDGYAFCLGVDSLMRFYKAHADLQSLIRSVTYLIRGAIFRPNYVCRSGGVSQGVCSLGELIDMYHTHEATRRHDKVYALLGMSSDNPSEANLLPHYGDLWEKLLQRLVKFLLCEKISVKTWGDKEIAVIKSKGCILGKVSSVRSDIAFDGRQNLKVIFKNVSRQSGRIGEWSAHWTVQTSAKPIRDGDLICLLQETSKPTIIRLCEDYFAIIVITAIPPEDIQTGNGDIKWPNFLQSVKMFTRDFLLVWDWENFPEKLQNLGEYETLIRIKNWVSEYSKTELEGHLDKATRIWNIALILEDSEEYDKAKKLRKAIEGYEIAFGEEHPYTLKSQYGLTPLSWAAKNGYDAAVKLLLAKNGIDPDLKDRQYGRTPLWWAAKGGHEAVVNLLLGTGKIEIDSEDSQYGRTPLWWAAKGGHEAVVKLLLGTGKVEIDSKDSQYDRTPLSWAAERGYEAVVKLLLGTGKIEIDSKDSQYDRTPLSWAAERGHKAVVKLLLGTGKVEIDSKDSHFGQTPLSQAAAGGHKAVVKLLLETGKIDVDSKDIDGWTPLSWAAGGGHEAVIKLLLETGKVDVDSKNLYGRTPLSWAAGGGYEAVVKLLLGTGKVEIDSKDSHFGQTPLSWAAEGGHEAVVKLLLGTGKVEIDSKDYYGRTPLWWAAAGGHKAVVKLLLETGKVEIDLKNSHFGQTPLSRAALRGHEAVVKLLESSIK